MLVVHTTISHYNEYYATADGHVYSKLTHNSMQLYDHQRERPLNQVRLRRTNGSRVLRIDFVLIWSYYVNNYNIMERRLYNVIHHNRLLYDNSIRNLVPVFSLKEKRDYFMWRLTQLHDGEAFKLLVTKDNDHVFENTLISESGVIFSIYWNLYQNIKFMTDARPVCSVYGKSRSTGRDVSETLYIHIGVSATSINHNVMPGMVVHHWDWNRFNNHWRNLVWDIAICTTHNYFLHNFKIGFSSLNALESQNIIKYL